MKKVLIIFAAIFILQSCKKPAETDPPSGIVYTNLSGKEIKFRERVSLDLNNDGKTDFIFSTLFVGDPIAKQDKEKYFVNSVNNSLLLINENDNTPILNKGDHVSSASFPGYNWEVAQTELAQKVTGINGPPFWEGAWKDVSHKYLPVQIRVNNQRFNGWIELSFDTEKEKIILHKAAMSPEADKELIAGV